MYTAPKFPVLPKLTLVKIPGYDDDDSFTYNEKAERLYMLDWKPKEKFVKDKYDDWKSCSKPTPTEPFKKTTVFPEEFIPYLYEMRFMTSTRYAKEIAYQAKRGQEEWSRRFPENFSDGFDTAVRETCLESAEAHFKTAFYLLSDCLYDPVSKSMRNDRYLAKVAMLMYFWDGQTGSGLLLDYNHSGGFDRLVDYSSKRHDQYWTDFTEKFVDATKRNFNRVNNITDVDNSVDDDLG